MSKLTASKMLRLTNLDDPRRRCFFAVLILLAVFTLTVRVATRYCFTSASSESSAKTVQKQLSPRSGQQSITQRLTKTTPTWLSPAVRSATLQAPASYPRVAPAGPPIPGLVLEKSLYNRPPPVC